MRKVLKTDSSWLLAAIGAIHEEIRDEVVAACEHLSCEQMSGVADDGAGDTIYKIDRVSESLLIGLFEERIAKREPITLIAEGLAGGKITLPSGMPEEETVWRVIADPVDGTRCLMYQKRSGWILTGVAPNNGDNTTLADIEAAVQTEIPLVKQHLSDTLWARRGSGARGERFNRLTGARTAFAPSPSSATDLAHGFSTVARFFSGARDVLAAIDDEIHFAAVGTGTEGKARCFEDQYLSTGGQLYELMMGHDRFLADLRPLLKPILRKRGWATGLCCHPYDLCTELIAREAGIQITDEKGRPIASPLNAVADVSWVGYCNATIRSQIEPLLQAAIQKHGLA
jgi:fructose-1,6-bisphosphatase/inositol monophosphatase family enzyme